MKQDKIYKGGDDQVFLTVDADADGITIEATGAEKSGANVQTKITWTELIEAMIRVAGRLE